MNNQLFIPMNSISTLIAEDTGTPELRNPLAYIQVNNGKNYKSKHRMNRITRWDLINVKIH